MVSAEIDTDEEVNLYYYKTFLLHVSNKFMFVAFASVGRGVLPADFVKML